ncbi:Hypothetical protein A7982_04016 [Minicystis rosea]|nr:Hypothetical protein A7982_04016 [Minicystis rosea]
MRHPRPALAAVVLGLSLPAACLPGAMPPQVPARHALDLGGEAAATAQAHGGPLAVSFASPRGETSQGTEISIVFNKPMRALGLGPSDPAPPVTMWPTAKGAFHWLGSSALRFDAEAKLAPATAYHVEIPAGTRALDDSTLAETFVLDFITPRANVVEHDPAMGATGVALDESVRLVFDEAVADAEIQRAVSIRGEKATATIPFAIKREGPTRVVLMPARPLPLADRIHVHVDASLRAEGGELPAGAERDITFTTVGPPSVKQWTCEPHPDDAGACDPDHGVISVELDGAVPQTPLVRAILVDPPVKWDPTPHASNDPVDRFDVLADFKPGQTYRVRLAPNAKLIDWSGQRLVPGAAQTFRFGHRPAGVQLGLHGIHWSSKHRHTFPTRTTNASNVEVHVSPRSLDEVLRAVGGAPLPPPGGPVAAIPEPRLDEHVQRDIPIDQLLPGARGVLDVVAGYTPRGKSDRRTTSHRLNLTDLGITARLGHGGAAVLVSDLDDASPIAGAEVAVYRAPRGPEPAKMLGSATTRANGEATPIWSEAFRPNDKLVIVARRGADWSYREIATPQAIEPAGFLYTERGLYRPGETVKLAGVIRMPGLSGLTTPRGAPVHISVSAGRGKPIAEIDTTLSEFGTLAVDVPIPKDGPVDGYRAKATIGDAHVTGGFLVSEYRPTEIAVEATTDRREYTRGDTLRCGVQGTYLHGGAMSGATATIVASRGSSSFEVPGLREQGFSAHDEERGVIPAEIARTRAKLDKRGALTFPITLALYDQSQPEEVSCAVEAMDLNRQALAARAHALVHPGELYVAIAVPGGNPVAPGDRVSPEIIAVTPTGERRAAKVHVDIVRRDGDDSRAMEVRVTSCDVTTGPAAVRCPFDVPKDATERARILVRASLTDRRGNMVRASTSLPVAEPPAPTPPAPTPPPEPPRPELSMTMDQSYEVGQTGHIHIASPYAKTATALVTIEREGILWQRVLSVPPAGARVDVPITDTMIPNARANVMMVSGPAAASYGHAFAVSAKPKRLAVTITTSGGERHRPGEAIDVDVDVKDAAGKPARAEITLWAADQGTLSLYGYALPDPWIALHDGRHTLAESTESRDDLVRVGIDGWHRARWPRVRMGATQRSTPRVEPPQTAFFAAHLVTDNAGKLRRRFTLPDGLTSYAVMAVAVTADDRAGVGEARVVTSLPLMARPTLPRIVRVGDRFEASVVISGTEAEGNATVSAEISGLTPASATRQSVRIERGTPAEVRFALKADRTGPARLTFRADLGKLSDAMTLTRDVITPLVPESASIDGETSASAAEALGDLSTIRSDYGGLDVSLSTTPLAGLADGVEQLVEYPYGCTEQTVSRLVPILALRDLTEALGTSLPAGTRRTIDESVARLIGHQRRDGGFGLWPESAKSDPWVSAWALWGLDEARRRGATVPPSITTRARAYLREATSIAADASEDRLALAAFFADVDAIDGHPDRDLASRLFAARDRLPPFSRALLLHALALAKDDPAHLRELARDLESILRLDGASAHAVVARHFERLLDSDTRTTAMILRAFLALDPAHPLGPRLARGILDARRGGRFRTTHDAAWALLALDDLRRARPPAPHGTSARVFLGDALLRESELENAKPVSFGVPAATLLGAGTRPLGFTATGPLHYHARLRFARRELPMQAVESGFLLHRTVRPLDGDGPDRPPGALVAGELVQVQLDVVTPSPRSAVVLESPLAGGLEAVATDLRLGGAWLRAWEKHERATRRELRDDRVLYFVDELPAGLATFRFVARASTPGNFVTPPARVEEMYAPDTFARTASETVTIVAP